MVALDQHVWTKTLLIDIYVMSRYLQSRKYLARWLCKKLYFPGGKVLTWQGDVVLRTPLETDTHNTRAERGRVWSGYHNLKVQDVPSFIWESSAKVTNFSNREGRNRNWLWLGNCIARISLQGSSKNYISLSGKYLPSGEIHFFLYSLVNWYLQY